MHPNTLLSRFLIGCTCLAAIALISSCSLDADENYDRFFVRTDGADLAVQIDGNLNSNTFILLLHGGPGGSGHEYNVGTAMDMLEEDYAMAYLDQRGQGASQGNYSPTDVTLQAFSDDIHEVVKVIKARYGQDVDVFLMGHSWGGTTGTHALLNTNVQEELNGWIEVGGAHDIPLLYELSVYMFIEVGNQEIAAGQNVDRWTEIVEYCETLDPLNISDGESGELNGMGHEVESLLAYKLGSDDGDYAYTPYFQNPLSNLVAAITNGNTSNLIYEESEEAAMTNRLNEITIPSLLLYGKYDFVCPPGLGESALEEIGTTEKFYVEFEQSAHSPMDNEPFAFVEEVTNFVEQYK